MIDKSLEFLPIYFCKTDTKQYQRYSLPEGYSFVFYKKGDEKRWAKIECELGQFESESEALDCFYNDFIKGQTLAPEERMLFVKDDRGEYVATASLWNGLFLGEDLPRVHWVAVSDKCTGKGIGKALISRIMQLYNELGYEGFICLLTATWYYPAISIYKKFGFEEYNGPRSPFDNVSDGDFCARNARAKELVAKRLEAYSKRQG